MTFPLHLLVEAITTGSVYITTGTIQDHCGYRDEAERVIALDPTVPLPELAAELADHLQALATANVPAPSPPSEPVRLTLVRDADHPDGHRAPRLPTQLRDDDPPDASGPRVVG